MNYPHKDNLIDSGKSSRRWLKGWFMGIRLANLTASKPVFTDASKDLTSSGTLALDQGGTGQITAALGFAALKQSATDIATGVVELATDAEAVAGSDTARACTPANLAAKMAAPGTVGGTTPGVATFTTLTATAIKRGALYEVSHNYAAGAVDWTLSADENLASSIVVTNANGAVNAIPTPTAGKQITVLNTSGQALTVKAAGQTGIVIASTKIAILKGNGTDFIRVTADA